jgi:transcriptional regulator of acetoin/glycerol metabolism
VSRAALSAPGRIIRDTDIEFLHAYTATPVASAEPQRLQTLAENERAHVLHVLESVEWNKKEAARVLEISRGTLYRKIVEYNLRPDFKLSRNRPPR